MTHPRHNSANALLEAAAAELAQIHRGKHYSVWRQDKGPSLGDELAQVEPFRDFRNLWLYTGDGGGIADRPKFGEWAIDLLVDGQKPRAILDAFFAEASRNSASYNDISPVFGARIDGRCDLGDGVELIPQEDRLVASMQQGPLFRTVLFPGGISFLCQAFTVTPAFERGTGDALAQAKSSVTHPKAADRDVVRRLVRSACLLVSEGPIELPLTMVLPDQHHLLVAREGNLTGRPFGLHPLSSHPVEAQRLARTYRLLGNFRELDSLERAVDRLGRSRLASSPVDRALELGVAAEIALMHDHSATNTEITHKIGSRAGWLLGGNAGEREAVFSDMKQLYKARSQAVHQGKLSSKLPLDLNVADRLVWRILSAILERGSFPDWNNLTMGGDGKPADRSRQT